MKSAVALIAALSLAQRVLSASVITVCSEAGNKTCVDNGPNRLCLNTDGAEDCGYCLPGYIQFRGECYFMDDIDFEELIRWIIDEYQPQLTDNVSNATRAARLERLCRIISKWRTQIPPPDYQLALNKFSLDTAKELRQRLGYQYREGLENIFPRWEVDASRRRHRHLQSSSELPSAVDWEAAGALTPVKDQGRCGCCWAVSTMTAVESAAFLTNSSGFLQSLSFQQLISCDEENLGCTGGNILLAMKYAWKNAAGGVTTLSEYPYTDKEGGTTTECTLEGKKAVVALREPKIVLTSFDSMTFAARRDRLKLAVSFQPVTMVLKSGCDLISSYTGGVLTRDGDCACSDVSCIDHAVVLVGYNDTAEVPYWKLRNSWSTSWGENGYFRIAQEGGGRWGLFGMLAEAAIPLDAYNSTGAVPDVDSGTMSFASGLYYAISIAATITIAALFP